MDLTNNKRLFDLTPVRETETVPGRQSKYPFTTVAGEIGKLGEYFTVPAYTTFDAGYFRRLLFQYNVEFSKDFYITNAPLIARFGSMLLLGGCLCIKYRAGVSYKYRNVIYPTATYGAVIPTYTVFGWVPGRQCTITFGANDLQLVSPPLVIDSPGAGQSVTFTAPAAGDLMILVGAGLGLPITATIQAEAAVPNVYRYRILDSHGINDTWSGFPKYVNELIRANFCLEFWTDDSQFLKGITQPFMIKTDEIVVPANTSQDNTIIPLTVVPKTLLDMCSAFPIGMPINNSVQAFEDNVI